MTLHVYKTCQSPYYYDFCSLATQHFLFRNVISQRNNANNSLKIPFKNAKIKRVKNTSPWTDQTNTDTCTYQTNTNPWTHQTNTNPWTHKTKTDPCQLYDKRDDFNFSIVNFPYLCSNIPASPAYGVYISQLIRYARACSTNVQFLVRGSLLRNKLMSQGFQLSRLLAAFSKFYGCYNDLIYPHNLSLGYMLSDMFYTNS
jgi:hypothetical protein